MLSVQKLNDNRRRLNQLKTKRGIEKENRDQIIEAIALTLSPKEFQSEEKSIDEQLAIMKRQKQEKKLLEYQLKTNPQTVSSFLANKYAEGNFNQAVEDRYDNSEERKKSGLTFDYHVYLPREKRYDNQRGLNRYVLSDVITDRRTGDSYTYHIPIYIDSSGEVPYFVADYYDEIIDDPKSRGLLWALKQLRVAIDSGRFVIDPRADEILTQWGFLVDGTIVHDIKGGVMVEKYLKSISPEEKKADAIRYMDKVIKEESATSSTSPLPADDDDDDDEDDKDEDDVDDHKDDKDEDDSESSSSSSSSSSIDDDADVDESESDQSSDAAPPIPQVKALKNYVKIAQGQYEGRPISSIAKQNGIPVMVYNQTKAGNTPSAILKLDIFTGTKVYSIGLRTAYQGSALKSFAPDIDTYHDEVLKEVSNSKLIIAEIPEKLKTLLTKKGFAAILQGKEPNIIIPKFDKGTPM